MKAAASAPAKVNLALHVTGRRDDGYHLLDSLVVFADVGDRVTVEPAPDWGLTVTGPRSAGVPTGDDNLVLRAARLAGGAPARITLDKHLPAAGGIGGGSSDAAATLRALAALDGRALPDVLPLGADLPVCLPAAPARMSGIGEVLSPVPPLPPLHLVLVTPDVAVPTGPVFAGLARRDNAPLPRDFPAWRDAAEMAQWLAVQRNDLEDPARATAPAIGVALARIAATEGCLLARMSGSGGTCFGIFDSRPAADAAAASLRAAHGQWWVAAAGLIPPESAAARRL
ncbi:4-(cytidine 5'-diphospho)-2-C-methyl-D-erythritol kinase [Mesobaculum littorinae]|uniref:4-diphosphocytidyl-2-C-methyl-D-erythritol kinase n=1 Tax=Mesobaculum littorinae TaxID=2486419 RepID=A0A438AGG6_9RHOB|nr:4-(cytidine 5'-diphospho)-2-C-methyl-D-erythritol kinase [Mesobaculum littorinae]RVV97800.1 4-(cytidine 5'-diphospho)-2-C-methyl-D-erythritol kinase [Mesobaculum littorinae]